MNKDDIIGLILKSEGGLNENEPAHVGGVSYAGITQKTYESWSTGKTHTPIVVQDLEEYPEVVQEFYEDYLDKFHVWDLPECLQYIHADFSINAGAAAVRVIQNIIGVDADGIWGSGTSRALEGWKQDFEAALAENPDKDNVVIQKYHDYKLAHYRNLAAKKPEMYEKYLVGWEKRAEHVLSQLTGYFHDDMPKVRAIDEEDIETTAAKDPVVEIAESIRESELYKFTTDELLSELKRRIENNG